MTVHQFDADSDMCTECGAALEHVADGRTPNECQPNELGRRRARLAERDVRHLRQHGYAAYLKKKGYWPDGDPAA